MLLETARATEAPSAARKMHVPVPISLRSPTPVQVNNPRVHGGHAVSQPGPVLRAVVSENGHEPLEKWGQTRREVRVHARIFSRVSLSFGRVHDRRLTRVEKPASHAAETLVCV